MYLGYAIKLLLLLLLRERERERFKRERERELVVVVAIVVVLEKRFHVLFICSKNHTAQLVNYHIRELPLKLHK